MSHLGRDAEIEPAILFAHAVIAFYKSDNIYYSEMKSSIKNSISVNERK